MQQDEAVHVQSAPNSSIIVNLDKSIGKQVLSVLYLSAWLSAIAIVSTVVLYDAFRITRQHVKVLEYDLMDLRQKTGHAHENTEQE